MPMKKGSGSLDFSGDDSSKETSEDEPQRPDSTDDGRGDRDEPKTEPTTTEPESDDEHEYPYFVRRSKVGDERDERIEVHLRSDVNDQESAFRNDLADALETSEVSKTDAREFALKYAFENPEAVAELMRAEGYGITD
ncbi:acyl-CoA dehydrogenase (plasmid) [Natrinema zhouii]|uniref:acyl-CoA dehydrogenase n=1 Tax=Natrinema zhouii TaxID=1710539 RepID=UPI001CFF7D0F|nr:acyl-CoA dehydrogenase [Natrinema zhouii]UHQ98246.1 acyl-CoA dehydrogenase [Natrinema zhouii]